MYGSGLFCFFFAMANRSVETNIMAAMRGMSENGKVSNRRRTRTCSPCWRNWCKPCQGEMGACFWDKIIQNQKRGQIHQVTMVQNWCKTLHWDEFLGAHGWFSTTSATEPVPENLRVSPTPRFATRSAVKIHPDDPFLDPSFIGLQHSDPFFPPPFATGTVATWGKCSMRRPLILWWNCKMQWKNCGKLSKILEWWLKPWHHLHDLIKTGLDFTSFTELCQLKHHKSLQLWIKMKIPRSMTDGAKSTAPGSKKKAWRLYSLCCSCTMFI